MDRGWVKLYRKAEDWEWYREPVTAHLFFHLLISANHQDRKWNGIDVPAGCLITSIRHLADQTGLTIQQVRTSLKRLKSTHDITQTSNKKYTLIKVNNYQVYQGPNTEANTLATQRQHSDNTVVTTNKNQRIKKEEFKNRFDDHSDCVADDLGEVFSVVEKNFSQDVAIAFKRFATHWDQKPPTRDELEAWLYVLMELKTDADRLACVKWSSGENPKGAWYRKLYTTGYRTPYGSKEPPTEPNLPDWYAEVPEEKATKKEIDAVIALQKAVAAGDAEAAERIQATILQQGETNGNPIN